MRRRKKQLPERKKKKEGGGKIVIDERKRLTHTGKKTGLPLIRETTQSSRTVIMVSC